MLTADLVDARKKDGELLLRPLDAEGRTEAHGLAETFLESARALVGKPREEVDAAWDAASTGVAPKRVKLAAGLRKLVADACTFEAEEVVDPVELRRVLFTHASEVRRTADAPEAGARVPFDREAVVADAARMLGVEPATVERAMFADLRSEHVLRVPPIFDAKNLVEAWELGQAQAVLLTAVKVVCEVRKASPGLVRALFGKLKFHQLLFAAERLKDGWRIVIDGPYSMFDAVTKYGLRLALALPALRALESWSLAAEVRWGKTREPLLFRLEGKPAHGAQQAEPDLHLSDEVRELAEGIEALGWRARPATVVLDVPGQGVCIPDLRLSRDDGPPVYVEVLGYWSRDAVFRRVELSERGLGVPIVFAVSSRLRVSAEVLGDDVPASLYVYKGKMSPRAVVEHAKKLTLSAADRSGG